MKEKKANPNIAIVTRPSDGESYAEPIFRFASILEPSASNLYIFTGEEIVDKAPKNDANYLSIRRPPYTPSAIIDLVLLQLLVSYRLILNRSKFDLVYFHKGAMSFVIPVLVCKLLAIPTCTIKVGAFFSNRDLNSYSDFEMKAMTAAQKMAFRFSDAAIVFSESETQTVPNSNVFVAYSNYRDFSEFQKEIPLSKRPVDVGLVNRFSDLKRVVLLSRALTKLLNQNSDLQVRLVGDGPEFETVQSITEGEPRIELTGWVERDELPNHYNDIRILVVPSKAEGLPTNVIEGMGCGTVVLAAPVGSIPDLINHGETGYLLRDASESGIEETLDDLIHSPDLERISENARNQVVRKYSLKTRREKFKEITNSILNTPQSEG